MHISKNNVAIAIKQKIPALFLIVACTACSASGRRISAPAYDDGVKENSQIALQGKQQEKPSLLNKLFSWTDTGWKKYVDLENLSPDQKGLVTAAYDELWQNPAEREVIVGMHAANLHVPVKINSGVVKGLDGTTRISAGIRQNDTPGKSEITIDFDLSDKICYSSEGQQIHLPLAGILSHENEHIAREESNIASAMRPFIYETIAANDGLSSRDIDKLAELGVKSAQIETYRQNVLVGEQRVNLSDIEKHSRLTTTQFNKFTEYFLSPQADLARAALDTVKVDAAYIERLLAGGESNRIGSINVQEAEQLLSHVDNGERLTLSGIENEIGRKISTAHLINYLPDYIEKGKAALNPDKQAALKKAMPLLQSYGKKWLAVQMKEEERTVQSTDARGSYPYKPFPRISYHNGFICK